METLITCSQEMLPSTLYKDSIKLDQNITSLMDQFYLDVGGNKTTKIFGVELLELHLIHIPEIIERLMIFIERYYLKEPGILIKKGNEQTVQSIVKMIDKGTSFFKLFNKEVVSQPKIAFIICDVIKHFALSIPENLLGKKYEAFVEASKITKEKDRFERFKSLIGELSILNRNMIARFMRFFKRVIAFSKDNKVTLEDLADEFGKSFSEPNTSFPKSKEEIRTHPSTIICQFLLLNGNLYFPPTQYPDTKFEDQDEDKKIIQSIRSQEEKRLIDAINKDGKKERKVQIFGVSLEKLPRPLPEILEKLICIIEKYYLAEEGLFRIPSHLSSQKKLVEAIEQDASLKELLETTMINRAHTICGTLKEFLRQLPEPILEIDKIDSFTSAAKLTNKDEKIAKLKELIDLHITEKGKVLLARWMRLFEKIILFSEKNKMTASSLAICLALNLVHIEDPTLSMTIAPKINKIFENIILFSDKLFPPTIYKETKYDDIFDPQIDSGDYLPLLVVDENEPFVTTLCDLYEGPPGYDETAESEVNPKSLEEQLVDLKRQESDKDVLEYLMNEEEEDEEVQKARNEIDKLLGDDTPPQKLETPKPDPTPKQITPKPEIIKTEDKVPVVHVINTKTEKQAPKKSILASLFSKGTTKSNTSRDGEKTEKVKLEHETMARPKQTGKREKKSTDARKTLDEMEDQRVKEQIEPPKTFSEPEKVEPKKNFPTSKPSTPITPSPSPKNEPELKKNFTFTGNPTNNSSFTLKKTEPKVEEKKTESPKIPPKVEKVEPKVEPKIEEKKPTESPKPETKVDEKTDDEIARLRRGSRTNPNRNSIISQTPPNLEKPAFTKRQNTKKNVNTNNLDETTVKQIYQALTSSNVLEMKERKLKEKSYPKSYMAFEIVEWLLWSYNITRKEALKIGQLFAVKGLLTSLCDETTFSDSNESFWST